MAKLTVGRLAKLLSDSFEEDGWGDMDPYWLKEVVTPIEDSDHAKEAEALREVLQRVVDKINGKA